MCKDIISSRTNVTCLTRIVRPLCRPSRGCARALPHMTVLTLNTLLRIRTSLPLLIGGFQGHSRDRMIYIMTKPAKLGTGVKIRIGRLVEWGDRIIIGAPLHLSGRGDILAIRFCGVARYGMAEVTHQTLLGYKTKIRTIHWRYLT